MSQYDYERDGERITREFPIGTAPQSVRVNGKRFNRVITAPAVVFNGRVGGRDIRFVAQTLDPSLNRFHKGEFVNDHGQKTAAFSGKQQIRDFERRVADAGVNVRYDDGSIPVRYGSRKR